MLLTQSCVAQDQLILIHMTLVSLIYLVGESCKNRIFYIFRSILCGIYTDVSARSGQARAGQSNAVQCNAMQCSAMHCSAVLGMAVLGMIGHSQYMSTSIMQFSSDYRGMYRFVSQISSFSQEDHIIFCCTQI